MISIILGIPDHDLTAALCHRWLCSRQMIPTSLSLLDVFTIISFLVVINIFHQYFLTKLMNDLVSWDIISGQ